MTALDDLPPLREVVQRHDLNAKKSLGQNFLFDLNLTGRIARAAGPLRDATVIEVGPGPGGLTRALLTEGARKVVAIERDERCLAALAEIEAACPGRLIVVPGDALEIDYAALAAEHAQGGPVRIVANLPYNIGTPLLTNWVESPQWPPLWDKMVLMFQREVAERIVATPAERADYGRLSILCGWRTRARILFDVPASAFTPPPKVTSSVVEITPREKPQPCSGESLARVAQTAFGQRRKMLRQSLKGLGCDVQALLAQANIRETARAEEIDIDGFVALANAWDAARGRA
ncbi:MAG: 16S rRNA (adenine(1518)-N(6)/adenine(1519)-N(6))-dimethyltransferase RsmA [Beijerinckiaceae bacterium]|nr:16S rRNA (adenine(1518)-N(6)/adenine(1519)-N(6))-dimethyltransferase RsmA [Beijerinckiaceae bacterium]